MQGLRVALAIHGSGFQNEAVGRRRLRGVAARGANVVALTVQGAKEVPERLWWGLEGLEA